LAGAAYRTPLTRDLERHDRHATRLVISIRQWTRPEMLFEPRRRKGVSTVRRERDAIIGAGCERVREMPVRPVQRRPGSGDLNGTRLRVAG